jgi:hypothetical protein
MIPIFNSSHHSFYSILYNDSKYWKFIHAFHIYWAFFYFLMNDVHIFLVSKIPNQLYKLLNIFRIYSTIR